jgi:putative tricarboxylic transport membrane protein
LKVQHLISQIGPTIMLAAGAGFAIASVLTLDLGSVRRMGAGAFPLLVGCVLVVLSLICLVQNGRHPMATDSADPLAVIGVVAGVSAFAFLSPILGVLPATAVAVFAAGSAIPKFAMRYRLLLAIGVALGVWLVFIEGLGMPFTAVRWP